MKNQKKKKESTWSVLNMEGEGRRLVQQIHVRQASAEEDAKTEQALDRLLTQIVEQVRAQGEKK